METIVLSKRNCHRADKVRQIAHPEYGDWRFEWRGQKLREGFMHSEYAHIASKPGWGNAIVVSDSETTLNHWEVVAWKYEVNFEDLWDVACRAFDGTSFSPEERAAQYIREYEAALLDDLKQIPESEQEQYIAKFKSWVRTLFDKHSRILSAMITGPARFPTRRNEKANNSYDSVVAEFAAWREKALKAIARRAEAAKPQEQKIAEEWERVKYYIDNCYLTSNLFNRIETVARNGNVEVIEMAIDYVRELNKQRKRPIFTERHRFFKLADVARAIREQRAAQTEKDDMDIPFEGGVVRYNFAEDRLQILFNEKPGPEMISKLKQSGFRWSPRFSAWQRQLTSNAKYAASRLLNINV